MPLTALPVFRSFEPVAGFWGIGEGPLVRGLFLLCMGLFSQFWVPSHEYASLIIARQPFLRDLRALLGKQLEAIQEAPSMAMTMNGEVQLAAPREAVWAKLNDPEVLKACIPGCEELEKTEDNGFRATAKMKVGPVSARFKGKVMLSDLDPPNGYRITGEGEGGVAGFAKGGATVGLAEKDGGTLLSYNVEAQIGGKLAQLGQRLINGAAKKLADEFFANFAKAVQG
jgi:carbon monoxide dehydrogenase subunit G